MRNQRLQLDLSERFIYRKVMKQIKSDPSHRTVCEHSSERSNSGKMSKQVCVRLLCARWKQSAGARPVFPKWIDFSSSLLHPLLTFHRHCAAWSQYAGWWKPGWPCDLWTLSDACLSLGLSSAVTAACWDTAFWRFTLNSPVLCPELVYLELSRLLLPHSLMICSP